LLPGKHRVSRWRSRSSVVGRRASRSRASAAGGFLDHVRRDPLNYSHAEVGQAVKAIPKKCLEQSDPVPPLQQRSGPTDNAWLTVIGAASLQWMQWQDTVAFVVVRRQAVTKRLKL
jgi:hypothetical protein